MATWPATLPQCPLREDWVEDGGWGVISSQPDVGPRITRRRFTATEKPRRASFDLTDAQAATFRTFFETTLAGGALPFDAAWEDQSYSYLIVGAWTLRPSGLGHKLDLSVVRLP